VKGSTARIWHRLGAEVLQTRLLLVVVTWGWLGHGLSAQEPTELTLESAVSLAMRSSYRIRQLELGIQRTRMYLRARQAQLKSSVSMDLIAPQFKGVSDYKWNSTLRRDEIVRQNTRLWEMGIAVSQPVILFGNPTDGYLSLHSRFYRYDQSEDDTNAKNYYNRSYLKLEQPLFRPNELKNDLEEAELDLEREDLEFLHDQVDLIEDVADDYYDLFEIAYADLVHQNRIASLKQLLEIVEEATGKDTAFSMEPVQVQVELENAHEELRSNQREYRVRMERLKRRLGMSSGELPHVMPSVSIARVKVDVEAAIRYGLSLAPRMRMEDIRIREQQIDLDNAKGRNSFHIDLEMTYGLEKEDEAFGELWNRYDNSYSVSVNANVPIWDWGRRRALINAHSISVKRAELSRTESEERITSEIVNDIVDLQEYQRRALSTQANVDRAKRVTELSIGQYRQRRIPLQDVLRSIAVQFETEKGFLDAYMGFRRSALELATDTYYDFENQTPLLERFAP